MQFENERSFREMVRTERLNLFLGAGFSANAKNRKNEELLVGNKLKDRIIDYFEIEKFKDKSLSRISSYLKRNRRGEFYHFLKESYTVGTYDNRYNILNMLPINNIFTTNIDDLIERIFNHNESKRFISDVEITGRTESPDINLYKLHGSVTYSHDKEMLFSIEEISTAFQKDPALWNAVAMKVASNATLFWGTNLDDTNIIEMLQPITIKDRPDKPKWIVILPGEEYDIDADEYSSMGFRIIRANTEELLNYLIQNIEEFVENNSISSDEELGNIFPLNYVEQIKRNRHPVRPIAMFYQGDDPTWGDVINNNIAKLSHYNCVVDKVFTKSNTHISGSPGCGKSTLLMQVAISSELKGHKLYFSDLTLEKAKFLIEKIKNKNHMFIFIDNLADNLDGYREIHQLPNITFVTAERDINYEQIKHLVKIKTSQILDISDLDGFDIQNICNSMGRPYQKFYNERVSLFEIVYKLWAGQELTNKIKSLIGDLNKSGDDLLEFYSLMAYVRYTRVPASMDMLFGYYSTDDAFQFNHIYDKVAKIYSLIDDSDYYQIDADQDYFSLRSRAFSELSIKHLPPTVLGKVLNKFHSNVHRGLIHRYDVFRKKAYDADLTYRAFSCIEDGSKFYEMLIRKDSSPYIKHQYSLYLWRKNERLGAWKQIDEAYTQARGKLYSINNTHAMILFDNNIDKEEDEKGTVNQTLLRSFEVLENCLLYDDRKSYHVVRYTDQAIRYHEKMRNSVSKQMINNASNYILSELNRGEYIPRGTFFRLKELQKKINKLLTAVSEE